MVASRRGFAVIEPMIGADGAAYLALAYLASPVLAFSAGDMFAPESFSAGLFMAALWALMKRRRAAYAVLLVLALSCRETGGLVARDCASMREPAERSRAPQIAQAAALVPPAASVSAFDRAVVLGPGRIRPG